MPVRFRLRAPAQARQRLFVKIVEAQARADLDNAFVAFNGMQIDAVLTSSDTFFVANARHIAELAISKRVAVLSTS